MPIFLIMLYKTYDRMISLSYMQRRLVLFQKYKAFAKEVENFQKVLKKKGAAAALDTFPSVEAALDEWLGEIDLPPSREL